MNKDEALKLALEALENIDRAMPFPVAKLAIKECKAALETKDEPVAWEQFHEHMAGPNYVAPQREYERGFIDGMQKQMQSSVDKAVNAMGKREWVELTSKEIKAIAKANEVILTGKMWVFIGDLIDKLEEKNT